MPLTLVHSLNEAIAKATCSLQQSYGDGENNFALFFLNASTCQTFFAYLVTKATTTRSLISRHVRLAGNIRSVPVCTMSTISLHTISRCSNCRKEPQRFVQRRLCVQALHLLFERFNAINQRAHDLCFGVR